MTSFNTCTCCIKNDIFIFPAYKHETVDVSSNVFELCGKFFSYYYSSDKYHCEKNCLCEEIK